MNSTAERQEDLKRFLYQYSHAKHLQEKGTHIIVAQDESWANCGTNIGSSWVHRCGKNLDCTVCEQYIDWADETHVKATISKGNKGPRCVFSHCITVNGLLCGVDDFGKQINRIQQKNSLDFNSTVETAELIFACKKSTGDYHTQMNWKLYSEYFIHRIIPAFNNLYPGKTMIFYIDQAPYHMKTSGFPQSNANKSDILEYYDQHEITSLSVKRDNNIFIFNRDDFSKRAPHGLRREELIFGLWTYLNCNKPEALVPDICKIASQYGHIVLFGCPNNPSDQPAEFFNAHVKYLVKKRQHKGRTIKDLYKDIHDGMYGGKTRIGRDHKSVSQRFTNAWFKLCECHMNTELVDLGFESNIDTLWNDSCKITINDLFIKQPWTSKTVSKWSKMFTIL